MNKSKISLLLILLIWAKLDAQIIECPADITVNSASLDPEYNYGEATVTHPDPYTLSEVINSNSMDCESDFLLVTTKTFTVTTDDGDEASCDQVIYVTQSEFSDFTFPADITIEQANPYNLGTELTGNISPTDAIEFAHTYDDLVIHVTDDIYKVLRTWTLLNWCTGNLLEQVQIININDALPINLSNNILDVNNNLISWNALSVTDENGMELDTDVCAIDATFPLYELLNCVYANNNTVESIELEIIKDVDDLNGVSTLDLVLIMRHILALDPLENQAQIIAAQINDDDKVSAIDLVELRKLILGIYSEFPHVPSWVFYHANILTADDTTDPTSYDLSFNAEEFPLDAFNVLAIKKGDVNGSVAPD